MEATSRLQLIAASCSAIPIYATSVDYEPQAELTQQFFATVQNKLHFAVHGYTVAELISKRANAENENMGLQAWKGERVRKSDVTIAKNYLTEDELDSLNRIVTMYLDYAEEQAKRHQPMYMENWIDRLNAFLKFNERDILENAGEISKEVADQLATSQYDKYHQHRLSLDKRDDFEDFIKNRWLDK
ncbi:RhuM family protein [Salicibibacter cibi]